jgi:hypothetical protein
MKMTETPENGWFYMAFGEPQGPVTAAELIDLTTTGNLTPQSMVRHESSDEWQPANTAFPGKLSTLDDYAQAKPERSGWVWVISGFYFLNGVLFFVSLNILTQARGGYYLSELTATQVVLMLFSATLAIAGAVMFFLIRKIALPIFVIKFGLDLIQSGLDRGTSIENAGESVGVLINLIIQMAACVYAWKLARSGRLE